MQKVVGSNPISRFFTCKSANRFRRCGRAEASEATSGGGCGSSYGTTEVGWVNPS